MNLQAVTNRVRTLLKALGGEEKDGVAPVPNAPPDPDALPTDSRMDGASPSEGDLADAGAHQAPQGEAPGPDGEGDDDGDEGGDGRPVQKGFDDFGNHDLSDDEVRELLKSFGVTPPTDEDKIAKGGVDVESVLEAILQGMERQNAVIVDLKKEVARLRSGHAENERSIAKALDALADPRTAPAAPPRAVAKALPAEPAPQGAVNRADLATRLFEDVRAGRLSPEAARAQARALNA